jgi:NAD(P)H-dependent nitrite reductase small subunit
LSCAWTTVEARVCGVSDVPEGEGRVVRVDDRPIAVFHTPTGWYALDNTCTHQGGPLCHGLVADGSVACPLHERRFALATGEAINHREGGVAAYPVEVRGEDVFLAVPVRAAPCGPAHAGALNGDDPVPRAPSRSNA